MSFRRKPESIQLGLDARFRGHDNSFSILKTQSSPLPILPALARRVITRKFPAPALIEFVLPWTKQ
jgi:hypothetical protein